MRQPAQHLLGLASSRIPWLLPAVGLALFVHKHFISYRGQGFAAAKAKASSRSRPPKLRRAVRKAKLHKDVTVVDVDSVTDAEHQRLDAMGLSSDRLMEWFTEDEVEALQQAQAHPAALISLLSGSQLMLDEQYDASDGDWYTDYAYDSHGYDSFDPEHSASCDSNASSNAEKSEQPGLNIKPLSELTKALSNSDSSAASSPTGQGQQQQWHAAQQLLQQLTDFVQQQQQGQHQTTPPPAETHSNAASADYFDPQQYYGLSPAANRHGRASFDMMQGNYLPRTGALWASSYPPHMDDLEYDDYVDDYLDREVQSEAGLYDPANSARSQHTVGGQASAASQAGAAAAASGAAAPAPQQQQQQPNGAAAARWLAEFEPPMPDFVPDLDYDPYYDFDHDDDLDYVPDFEPDFDDAFGFADPLDAAFAAAAPA